MSDSPPASVGESLRSARESKGLSLDEAERVIRIRARLLAALEADDVTLFTTGAQLRGFLKIYAEYLGLDAAQTLTQYEAVRGRGLPRPAPRPSPLPTSKFQAPPEASRAAGLAEPRPSTGSTQPTKPMPPVVKTRDPRMAWLDMLIAAGVTIVLALLLLWGGAQLAGSTILPTATRPALSGLLATNTPAGTLTPTPVPPSATPTLDLTPARIYTGVNLVVRAEQRVWLRVVSDGVESFAGLLAPGDSREFTAQNTIELITSNGRGTRVAWNGQDQGTLGEIGEVVVRLWTPTGVILPTPTVTPTPPPTVTTAP